MVHIPGEATKYICHPKHFLLEDTRDGSAKELQNPILKFQ